MEIMGYTGEMRECEGCHKPFPVMKGHTALRKCLKCRNKKGWEQRTESNKKKQTNAPATIKNGLSLTPEDLHYIYKRKPWIARD
jgi:hypothetical protein